LGIDTNRIRSQLELLDRYYARLKNKQNVSRDEFITDADLQAIVERNFQLAIECCLNIGTHLIAALSLDPAEDYGTVFMRLAQARIIPMAFANKLVTMVRFRNVPVYGY